MKDYKDYSEIANALKAGAVVSIPWESLMVKAADAIKELQSEVKRMIDYNDSLREAQMYIDHYGDKWMTSAKDVPTAAYNHGYADGRDEALKEKSERIERYYEACLDGMVRSEEDERLQETD